jgi:hypothetical protein
MRRNEIQCVGQILPLRLRSGLKATFAQNDSDMMDYCVFRFGTPFGGGCHRLKILSGGVSL